jgi:hypothetical protein
MSSKDARAPIHPPLDQRGAAFGGRLSRFANAMSSPNARKTRRQVRRWLNANALTVMLVLAMMVFAWMITSR